MAQYDGSIRINTEILIKSAEKQLRALENNMEKTAERAASLRGKMEAMRNTQIPTEEYKEIQKQIASTESKLVSLRERQEKFLETGGKQDSSVYKKMEYDADQLTKTLEFAKADMQSLVDSGKAFTLGSSTEEYAKLGQQLKYADASLEVMNQQHEILQQRIEAALQKETEYQNKVAAKEEERRAKEEENRAKEVAAIQAQEEEERRIAEIRENAVVGNQRIIETAERIKQLEQEIADLKAAGVTEGYQDYDSRTQELSELKQEIRDYNNGIDETKERYRQLSSAAANSLKQIGKSISRCAIAPFKLLGNIAKKAFSNIGKGSKSSSGVLNGGLKTILKYGLGIRSLYAAFNKLRTAIKEGFTNLYNDKNITEFKKSVDSLKASILTLKNSFAAAFRPIVETAIPYIQRLTDHMSQLLEVVSRFMAAITGQKKIYQGHKTDHCGD